jgi:hypothetical protein
MQRFKYIKSCWKSAQYNTNKYITAYNHLPHGLLMPLIIPFMIGFAHFMRLIVQFRCAPWHDIIASHPLVTQPGWGWYPEWHATSDAASITPAFSFFFFFTCLHKRGEGTGGWILGNLTFHSQWATKSSPYKYIVCTCLIFFILFSYGSIRYKCYKFPLT